MKFVTYNIQYGLGKDGKYDLRRIADAVQGADVIALQEVERFWQRSGMIDQAAEISAMLPDHHWDFAAGLDMDASYCGDDGKLVNRRRQHGVMLLSKNPIISARHFLLPKFGTLVQHSTQHVLLEAVIAMPAGPIRVNALKFCHLCAGTRMPQIKFVLKLHAQAVGGGGVWSGSHPNPQSGWTEGGEPPMPRDAIFMGDMNFPPKSAEYDAVVGPTSHHHGRINRIDGLLDAWVAADHAEDEGITCPGVADPHEPAKGIPARLDYAFVTPALARRVQSAWIDEEAEGSDHQPVWFEIDVESPEPRLAR